MVDYRKGPHTVYDIKYHLVWVTKYPYKVLKGDLALRVRDLIRKICERNDVRIIRGHVSQDHVQVFVSAPPQLSVSKLMQYINSSFSRLQPEQATFSRQRNLPALGGSFLIYFDTIEDERGAGIDVDKRPILIVEPYQPEYRLDIGLEERKGTSSGTYAFCAWDGAEWRTRTLAGGAVISSCVPSLIELQIPKSTLGNPTFVNLGVGSVGRGRIHTAGDILGTDAAPSDWKEPLVLDVFARYQFSAGSTSIHDRTTPGR